MANLEVDVTYETGEVVRYIARPVDFVAWERHTKRSMSDLASAVGMQDLAYLAWSASRRRYASLEEDRPPFDVWLERVAELDEVDDDELEDQEQGPTPPVPSDDGSSSS